MLSAYWFNTYLVLACLFCLGGPCSVAALGPSEFEVLTNGPQWHAAIEPAPDGRGTMVNSVVARLPGNIESQPGGFAGVSVTATVPSQGPAKLCFGLSDSFDGPTAGYHYAELLVEDEILLARDVAGGTPVPQPMAIDLRKVRPQGGLVTIVFRLANRKRVTNFPVVVRFLDPVLTTAEGADRVLPLAQIEAPEPLPPDLPMPSLEIAGRGWTRTACIVQPWGRTQHDAIVHAKERAPWLAAAFGFNAVIILPPDAHNANTNDEHHITDAQFLAALDAYRDAGMRIIIYTSIMHCGHDPAWEFGRLRKEHPEWSQRGPEGEPVTIYGSEWLCPSTGALDLTIEYTRKLLERYAPDAFMLDNNEFFSTPSGITCYCDSCQIGFRKYVAARFGKTVLGEPTDTIRIPAQSGAMYNLWLHWRNRVWAEATERFRVELRGDTPDLVVLANTQYLFASPNLATDFQYGHEDAVLSESRHLTNDGMIDKLLLGKALAKDRPLWNYLGTFQDDFAFLSPPDEVAVNVSTAFALAARPWVVYYGFYEQPDRNKPSLDRMASVLIGHRKHDPARRDLEPFAPVRSLVSLVSRNCRGTRVVPTHLTPLRHSGVASRVVDERALTGGGLDGCRALLIEEAPCLTLADIEAIVAFVKGGGLLITSPSAGLYDEIGRPRPRSPLWATLGLKQAPLDTASCGKGEVMTVFLSAKADRVAERLTFARFITEPPTGAAVLPYLDGDGNLVVYVCGTEALPKGLRVKAPGGAAGKAIVCSPDRSGPYVVPLTR